VMLRGIELGEIVDGVKDRKEFIERFGERAKENDDRYQSRTCEDSCIRSGHFHGGICSTTWNHHKWRGAGPEEQKVSTRSKERPAKHALSASGSSKDRKRALLDALRQLGVLILDLFPFSLNKETALSYSKLTAAERTELFQATASYHFCRKMKSVLEKTTPRTLFVFGYCCVRDACAALVRSEMARLGSIPDRLGERPARRASSRPASGTVREDFIAPLVLTNPLTPNGEFPKLLRGKEKSSSKRLVIKDTAAPQLTRMAWKTPCR